MTVLFQKICPALSQCILKYSLAYSLVVFLSHPLTLQAVVRPNEIDELVELFDFATFFVNLEVLIVFAPECCRCLAVPKFSLLAVNLTPRLSFFSADVILWLDSQSPTWRLLAIG